MGKILYRYIVKEQLTPLFVSFLGLNLILISGRLMQLSRDSLFLSAITMQDLIQITVFLLPALALYTLPMATMMGTLFAFLRLSSDNELNAIRSAGIGLKQLWPSVLTIALVTTLIALYSSIQLLPTANSIFQRKIQSLEKALAPAILRDGVFIDIIPNFIFFFKNVNHNDLSAEGVFIQYDDSSKSKIAIVAENVRIIQRQKAPKLILKFSNGIITGPYRQKKNNQNLSFGTYYLPLSTSREQKSSQNKKDEMTIEQLHLEYLKTGSRPLTIEFHLRLALPVACLLFCFIAVPLGTIFKSHNRMAGISISLGIFMTYYILMILGKSMAETTLLPPFVGIWTPNLVVLILTVYLWIKSDQGVEFKMIPIWTKL